MNDIVRTVEGETAMGMKVAGWRWESPVPVELQGSKFFYSYASHWSTGPVDAVRLFTETDVRNKIAEAACAKVVWYVQLIQRTEDGDEYLDQWGPFQSEKAAQIKKGYLDWQNEYGYFRYEIQPVTVEEQPLVPWFPGYEAIVNPTQETQA